MFTSETLQGPHVIRRVTYEGCRPVSKVQFCIDVDIDFETNSAFVRICVERFQGDEAVSVGEPVELDSTLSSNWFRKERRSIKVKTLFYESLSVDGFLSTLRKVAERSLATRGTLTVTMVEDIEPLTFTFSVDGFEASAVVADPETQALFEPLYES